MKDEGGDTGVLYSFAEILLSFACITYFRTAVCWRNWVVEVEPTSQLRATTEACFLLDQSSSFLLLTPGLISARL